MLERKTTKIETSFSADNDCKNEQDECGDQPCTHLRSEDHALAFEAHHLGCLKIAYDKNLLVLHVTELVVCPKSRGNLPRTAFLADIDLLTKEFVGLGMVPDLGNLSNTNVNLCEIRLVATGLSRLTLRGLSGLLLLLAPLSFFVIFILLLLDICGTQLCVGHDLRK